MASSKWMNLVCVLAMAVCVAFSACMPPASAHTAPVSMGYEDRLFDTSRVHTIDIRMDAWDTFIKTCANEEYAACDVSVDGEIYKNVAIRAKGNTSLSSVSQMDSDRYSFKIEFDHYDSAFSYHGLDKLSLNNLIQDNTFMKDYLTYRMMDAFGVPAPLVSFAYITVNGEDWGLYLAVEGVEDAFLLRNYGKNHGELYKPDSMDMGGGRGNGKAFDMEDFKEKMGAETEADFSRRSPGDTGGNMPGGFSFSNQRGGFGGRGSDDVKLVYTDDEFDSYSNIFENAKTDVTDRDKTRLIDSIKRMNEGDTSAVNTEDVIRYFVVHNFVVNDDSYTGTMIHNYYLYEENGVLSMIPWDYNLAYGTFQGGNAASSVNRDILSPVTGGMDDRPMVKWIFESEAYTDQYKAYFEEFINTVNAKQIIEDAQMIIAPYVNKDPTKFCTYEAFETGVSALKTFAELRSRSVLNQLSGTNETVNTSGLDTSDMGTMGMGGKGNRQIPDMPTSGMPSGNFLIPEMRDGGMLEGDMQFPGSFAGDMKMPEMPDGGMPKGDMSAMIPGGFTPPGMSGAETTNKTPAPDTSVQTDMPDGAMLEGGMQIPGFTNGDMQIPEMPMGWMGAAPPDGFTPPGMSGAEIPNETPAPDTSVQTDSPEAATNTDSAPSAGKTTNETRSTRGNRTNFTSGFPSSNAPGANESTKTIASSESLLIASICVLLASIAIALFIKHE